MTLHLHALDSYRAGGSLVHRLDARVKVVLAGLFIVAVALTPEGVWPAYILLTAVMLSVVIASQVGVGFVQRRAMLVFPFALAALTVVFSTPGRPLWAAELGEGKVAITGAGVTRFFSILLKSWLAVQMAIVVTVSTPFPSLLRAMRSLGVPRALVASIGFAYRYLFVIGDEALRLMRARAARSGSLHKRGGGSLLWRAWVTGNMIGSLFLRSIERAERIYDAMLARGYDGEVRLLSMPPLRWRDLVLAVPFILVLGMIEWLAWM